MMMMASPGVGLGGDYSTGMAGSIYAIDDGKIIEPKEVVRRSTEECLQMFSSFKIPYKPP